MKKATIILFILLLPCIVWCDEPYNYDAELQHLKNAARLSREMVQCLKGEITDSPPPSVGELVAFTTSPGSYISFDQQMSLFDTEYVFYISEDKEVKINGEAIKAMPRDELIRLGAFISLITRLNANADDIGILGRKLLPEYFEERGTDE